MNISPFVRCSETAINIGYSCKLLTDEMEEIYIVDGDSFEEVESQLQKAREDMQKHLSGINNHHPPHMEVVSFQDGGLSPLPNGQDAEEFGGFAFIINGHSLVCTS